MITATTKTDLMSKSLREAIVDRLRACKTREELLAFDSQFNQKAGTAPLYVIICDFLHDRTISRALAAKLLRFLIEDREEKNKL